jgi:polyhydroxyalkanoate synthase
MQTSGSAAKATPDPLTALFAEQQRILRRALNAPSVFELARATQVGTTPHDVVYQQGSLKLLRYRRSTPPRYAQPVLFCYALINRPYILDLQEDKSIVRRYLEQGFDVYLLDWGVPSEADHRLTIEDYVCVFLKQAIDFILGERRRQDLHLLGYCMGGTMSALFTAVHPERISTLTLLAAPIDFSGRDSLLNLWTDQHLFDVDAFIDLHRNCPAWFLQSCFLNMRPIQNYLERSLALYEQMDDQQALTYYFAMERWINDNVPVAGETFRQFVKQLYQRNELVRGEFHLSGQPVDLGRIRCPLLLLTARNDHLVPPAATEGIRPHVGSQDVGLLAIEAGHVGLVVGGKAQRTTWPQATRWLGDRSTPAS